MARFLVDEDLPRSLARLKLPLGSHRGMVVARLPSEVPVARLNAVLLEAVRILSDDDLRGGLAIIEPNRIRLRRSH